MPEFNSGSSSFGSFAKKAGRYQRDHAKSDSDCNNEQIVAVRLLINGRQNTDSGRGNHSEHDDARPAENEQRHRRDQRAKLRDQAKDQQDDAADCGHPAAADAGDADQSNIL